MAPVELSLFKMVLVVLLRGSVLQPQGEKGIVFFIGTLSLSYNQLILCLLSLNNRMIFPWMKKQYVT